MALDPIELPEHHENTPGECDAALGLYMRAWNQLEISTFMLFRKLVDTDITTSSILFNAGIEQRTIRSILNALGKHRLQKSDYEKLSRMLRRMKNVGTVRNRLVHGRWQLNLKMKKGARQAETAEWVRFYLPTDPETYQQIYGKKKPNQKLLAQHQFTLKRIIQNAKIVGTLAHDVRSFDEAISLLPARIPQPVF